MKNFLYKIQDTKYLILFVLFFMAFGERVLFDFGPNYEFVTAAMIISSIYIGRKESLLLVFAVMVLTDIVIGNTNIFLFTWSGFLIPALFVRKFYKSDKALNRMASGTLAGLTTVVFFFLWTNFGVWLLSDMYSKTLYGLIASYINALPFLRFQAVSAFISVPLGIITFETAITLNRKYKISKRIYQAFQIA